MITKYLNKIYFLLGIIFFFSACTDDLNVLPTDDDEFLSEDFYNNAGSYEQALAGVYGNLSLTGTSGSGSSNIAGIDAGTSQYGRVLWYLQDLAADEALWSYENDPGTKEIQRNIWTPANPIFRGMYGRAMFSVALANDFLRESTDEKLAERGHTSTVGSEIVAYRAEARLLRALSYYHLMDLFGKAAFVTEADPVGTFQAPQYDRAQLFNFIKSELTDIEGDLKAPRTNQYARADKAVAWMILAKIYLNAKVYIGVENDPVDGENYYTKCIDNCNKIFGGGYELASNYLLNFMADNNSNEAGLNEIIFPLVSDGVVTQNYGPTTVIINGEVGSIEKNQDDLGAQGWGGALRVRKQFAEKFIDQGNDDRNTLITAGRDIEVVEIADKDSGYILTKFSNRTSTGAAGSDPTYVDTDFPLFRLADVYLMYAEAIIRRDGVANGDALNYVNDVRDRAHASLISLNDLTLSFLIDERSRELHWEAHRRQDLVRFGLYTGGNYNWAWKGNGSNGIAISNHMAVYPMPSESLAANPNLTQNTGY
ncbi:RagB/SusD family nutrient uptake outer membrane protein [Lutibacter sp.]|uniref:RagB/SusD family nutrient uptake outer membrane protein n=1 Tax=Lutibacter sp. TaxID=1925666 RepID=UPI00356788DA